MPSATLLVPRRDAKLLMLERSSLADRRDRAIARLDAMLNYALEPARCRTRMLLEYFGEALTKDCGTCDRCRAAVKAAPAGVRGIEAVDRARWQLDEEGVTE